MKLDSIDKLDPTVCFRGTGWALDRPHIRNSARKKFKEYLAPQIELGLGDYDSDRISTAIFYFRTLLQRFGLTGRSKVALEIGCGTGNKSLAINDLFGRYIGVDLLPEQIAAATERSRMMKAENTSFICGNAADILSNRDHFDVPAKIDVLILYAVVEHLTLEERPLILSIADKVISEGGIVIVMEAPNRLIPFDSHTTGTHFFNWLPDRLAYTLAQTEMNRRDIANSLTAWSDTDPSVSEHLYRLGRGVSYHDFQFGLNLPLKHYGFPVSSFVCETLNMEPLQFQEIALLGYFTANIPDIPAGSFSRCWIDTVITGNAMDTKKTHYISPHWPDWIRTSEPPVFWSTPSIGMGKQNPNWKSLPDLQNVDELNLLFNGSTGSFNVSINGKRVDEVDIEDVQAQRFQRGTNAFSLAYKVSGRLENLTISADSKSADFVFQGAIASSL